MLNKIPGEILEPHGSDYEYDCLLRCCAVQSGRSFQTFQRYLLPHEGDE
jgi:hypothetical protein